MKYSMKRFNFLLTTMMLSCAMPAWAQHNNDDKEITVTTANGKNEVIDLPEGMTYELDSLLKQYNAEKYLRNATDCNMPNVNPTFPKEVYIERLSRIPSVIEMPYNDVVQKFIDRYSGRLRRSVSYVVGASNFYMPIFEEALEAYGLPLELKYLPVIESALNPKAVSRVGATGLWQFMLGTGKQYGLTVNSLIDERSDIAKSSFAAAHYLSDLYRIFGDWNLVIAAYNAGPENINKAIHRAKGEKDYWKIYPFLPQETRGYVPAFIAANYIMNYYCEHNICPMTATLPIKTDTVVVHRDIHFNQLSGVLGIDLAELAWLTSSSTSKKKYLPTTATTCLPGGEKWKWQRLQHLILRRAAAEAVARSMSRRKKDVSARNANGVNATKAVARAFLLKMEIRSLRLQNAITLPCKS